MISALPDTSGAVNATSHDGLNEGANVLVLHSSEISMKRKRTTNEYTNKPKHSFIR